MKDEIITKEKIDYKIQPINPEEVSQRLLQKIQNATANFTTLPEWDDYLSKLSLKRDNALQSNAKFASIARDSHLENSDNLTANDNYSVTALLMVEITNQERARFIQNLPEEETTSK